MTKQTEVLKLALEALEMSHELADTGYIDFKKYGLASDKVISAKLSTAITALRDALAEQPAQRTWVGLTDEEKSDIWCVMTNRDFVTEDTHVYADAIEAKLKELNTCTPAKYHNA